MRSCNFEYVENAFDSVAIPVASIVWMLWRFAVLSRWDNRQDASHQQALAQTVTIVSFIGQ